MYKYTNGLLPDIFKNFYTQNKNIHKYPTKSACLLRVPLVRLDICKRSIKVTGVKIWNCIHKKISGFSIHKFKKQLKAFLLANDVNF
jgi:hypothetical protein